MPSHIHNKGQGEVEEYGGSEGQERQINEKKTDAGAGNPKFFTQGCAHSKRSFFKKLLYFFYQLHTKNASKPPKTFHLPELMPFYRLKIQLTNITGIRPRSNGLILIFLPYHCKKKPINLALQLVKNLLNQNP